MLDYTGQTFVQFPFWSWTSQSGGAAPTPEPEVSTGAGRSRRRRHKYLVEIDGQEFQVDSVEQAQALLSKAKALAEKIVVDERKSIVVKAGIKVPQIRTPNKELVPLVQKAREEIKDLYAELKRDLEIKFLMARAEEEEEEAIIRLLM